MMRGDINDARILLHSEFLSNFKIAGFFFTSCEKQVCEMRITQKVPLDLETLEEVGRGEVYRDRIELGFNRIFPLAKS